MEAPIIRLPSAAARWGRHYAYEDLIDDLAPDTNAAHVLIKEPAALKDQAVRDTLAFLVQQTDIERY